MAIRACLSVFRKPLSLFHGSADDLMEFLYQGE
jgi:hypothetical protein